MDVSHLVHATMNPYRRPPLASPPSLPLPVAPPSVALTPSRRPHWPHTPHLEHGPQQLQVPVRVALRHHHAQRPLHERHHVRRHQRLHLHLVHKRMEGELEQLERQGALLHAAGSATVDSELEELESQRDLLRRAAQEQTGQHEGLSKWLGGRRAAARVLAVLAVGKVATSSCPHKGMYLRKAFREGGLPETSRKGPQKGV
eukprot:353874-Chlamydomonas_euryale.AAC.4